MGAIEARYGKLDESRPSEKGELGNGSHGGQGGNGARGGNGHAYNKRPDGTVRASKGNGAADRSQGAGSNCEASLDDCCADGVLESTAKLKVPGGGAGSQPRNFEEFIYQVWGAGVAKHFAVPYNRKLWAVPLHEMETSWLGGRVPMPDLREMIQGALMPVPKPMGPNARFGYPLRGGFQALMDGFLPYVSNRLQTGAEVMEISPSRHTLRLSTGQAVAYEKLISTMPLPLLIRRMGTEAPAAIQQAARRLRHVSVRCVHLGINREKITDKHWIYYPEDTVFHRIFVQGNASPHCNPPGGFGLTCEITYSPHKPLPCEGRALIDRCIDDCRKVGMINETDRVAVGIQADLPHAYVVYDHQRAEIVAEIRQWLAAQDIILAGRYSEWEYYNSDHAFIAGKRAAEAALASLSSGTRNVLVTTP
jgi:UDP-galactopyranose mutase